MEPIAILSIVFSLIVVGVALGAVVLERSRSNEIREADSKHWLAEFAKKETENGRLRVMVGDLHRTLLGAKAVASRGKGEEVQIAPTNGARRRMPQAAHEAAVIGTPENLEG